jgi:hypothetical protein
MTTYEVEFSGKRKRELVDAKSFEIHETGALMFYTDEEPTTLSDLSGNADHAYTGWSSVEAKSY